MLVLAEYATCLWVTTSPLMCAVVEGQGEGRDLVVPDREAWRERPTGRPRRAAAGVAQVGDAPAAVEQALT
jgi:hypothetical protein